MSDDNNRKKVKKVKRLRTSVEERIETNKREREREREREYDILFK